MHRLNPPHCSACQSRWPTASQQFAGTEPYLGPQLPQYRVDVIANRSGSYVLNGDKLTNAQSFRALRPSGAFFSNLKDMVRFGIALESDGPIKKATLDKMMAAFKLNDGTSAPYGLGFQVSRFRGKDRKGHGGSLSGFRSDFAMFPDDGLTIIVLANLESANPALIANLIADVYIDFPQPATPVQ
ncbi:serine hydrolase [Leptolyngbya sp. 7M]|nr:serine hydrolase [Leptolyngbya sp. 7M]